TVCKSDISDRVCRRASEGEGAGGRCTKTATPGGLATAEAYRWRRVSASTRAHCSADRIAHRDRWTRISRAGAAGYCKRRRGSVSGASAGNGDGRQPVSSIGGKRSEEHTSELQSR